MFRTTRLLAMVMLALVCTGSGCQLFKGGKLSSIPNADEEHPVVEIICVWQPGEGTGLDGLPCRGFAGQILFFALGEKAPVRVNGKVRVYVFDDQGTQEEQERPIHQFDFDAKSFQSFLTQTNMGGAYQLFIPYTRKGSHSASCTLRVRYRPEEGSSVYSKMATIVLPGTTSRKATQSIEEATSTTSRESKMIAEVLQLGEKTEQTEQNQVMLAGGSENASSHEANKQRLRKTLTEISKIDPATATSLSPDASSQAVHEKPQSFQRHPLSEMKPAESGSTSRHPILSEDEPATPLATPAAVPRTSAEKPIETSAEKPTTENSIEKVAEKPTEEAAEKPVKISAASHHPLAEFD